MQVAYKGVKDKVILMKVTSRGRPENLIYCAKAYFELAENPIDMVWLFSFDEDDKEYEDMEVDLFELFGINYPHLHIYYGERTSKIGAINRDIEKIKEHWDILLNISDDQLPIVKGYDNIIRKAMPNNLDASLWFDDGWGTSINVMEILGRTYYNNQGHVYDPRFNSFFCDQLATKKGEKSGKLLKSSQCIIKHFHPIRDKSIPNDGLYEENQKYWKEDQEVYNQLIKEI